EALPRDDVALQPFNLVGVSALRRLFGEHSDDLPGLSQPVHAITATSLVDLVDDIAADGHGLVMVMGKGGVGKTTIAAAIATSLARRGLPVHLTTSDPAAHLAQ